MPRHFIDISRQLESWYQTQSGQYLLATEKQLVNEHIQQSFGNHLVQIGFSSRYPLYADSPISHRLSLGGGEGGGLVTELAQLPFDSDSLDLVILHHSLEFYEQPHQLLREVQRCIRPQGKLLIVAFNPLSLLGIYAQTLGRLPGSLWKQRAITRKRLGDWLALLGFDTRQVDYGYIIPPVQHEYFREKMTSLDQSITAKDWAFGGVFVMNACKQVSPLTPVRQRWSRVRSPLVTLTASRSSVAQLSEQGEVKI